MKKIISVLICIFMIASVMSFSAFADGYTKDYGQHTIKLGESKTPTVDGTISEGEYTYSEGVSEETTIFGSNNITATTYYLSYDETNVYIAGVVSDASEHAAYVNALWVYISGDANDFDNAWRIYMTKSNGTMVEHWQITDGAQSNNLWDPIDSKNGENRKHGMGDRNYEFSQSFAGGVYTYELSLNRADWGLTGDKILIAMAAASSDGDDIYGFKSEELMGTSTGLSSNTNSGYYGVYMYEVELDAAETSEAKPAETKPVDTTPVETTPAETTPSEPVECNYSIMDLGDFGQQNWVIEGKTDNPPVADGIIEEDEYTLKVLDMLVADDDIDDRFFCIDPDALDIENFDLYLSYDDEYFYIGAVVTENEFLDGERMTFVFSCNPADMHDGVSIGYVFGGTPTTSEAEAFNAVVDGNKVTYEIIIRRTLLIDYMGYDDVDDIKEFALLIVMGDDRDAENYPDLWPEIWFGCTVNGAFDGLASSQAAAASEGKIWGKGADGRRFPHVMKLGDAPETQPAETTPVESTSVEYTPAESTPTESAPVTDPATSSVPGCGSSITAIAVALVATLGTCVTFVNKRR